MFIIKCDTLTEVWSNEINHEFLHSVPKYFAKRLVRPVDASELEVYYVESEADRLKLWAHHPKHLHEGVKLNGNSRKADLVNIVPERVEAPALKVGDDDPDDPGTPVAANDPRTKPTIVKRKVTKVAELVLKKVLKWDEHESVEGSVKKKWKGNQLE